MEDLREEVERELAWRMEKTGRTRASFVTQALAELFGLAYDIPPGSINDARVYIGNNPL